LTIHPSPDLPYQLALLQVPHIGYVHAKTLSEHFGSAAQIFKAGIHELEKLEGIGEVRARSIKSFKEFSKVDKEIKFIQKYNIQCFFLTDEHYPKRLLNCYDPPTILFYKGNADLNASRIVAIVGTRNNTEYGKSVTEKLVKEFASLNCIIVSGLAFGIDSIAHRCALKYNIPTIGVVGHGLDTIYPQQNANLAKQMLKEGGMLTEFRSNTKPDKYNFPSRNRVVAGISDATIIVESGVKGGSVITAQLAYDYNRDVFAVPGRTVDIKSGGCNELIRNNVAILLQEPGQFAEVMGWTSEENNAKPPHQKQLFVDLSPEEKQVFDLLAKSEFLTIDELNFQSNISSSVLAGCLLQLEMKGVIILLPGKKYKLTER
jgi:DNA processing protein